MRMCHNFLIYFYKFLPFFTQTHILTSKHDLPTPTLLAKNTIIYVLVPRRLFFRYTHKTSSYWTSSYKMSSYKTSIFQTSSYKTSRLQNVLITKRPYYQTSKLPNVQLTNVQLQNVHTRNYYKTSSFSLFSNTDNYDGFSSPKKYVLYLTEILRLAVAGHFMAFRWMHL
jgi:hypothetical protein